jgi:predicted RNase H-like nuclease
MKVVGLDASGGQWLAVALDDLRVSDSRIGRSATELANAWPDANVIAIDIPIGLPAEPLRAADRAAREFVGARRSSVFATFPEEVLRSPSYEEARALCESKGWPKPSIQSYGMRHRILEVAELAVKNERVIEVHPEVSFRELVGHELAGKRTGQGASERRRALRSAGIEVPDLPYPLDDVLDATIAAWTARRYALGEAEPLPEWLLTRIGPIWR